MKTKKILKSEINFPHTGNKWVGRVMFRRKKDSEIEFGIGIGNDSGDLDVILDNKNSIVDAPIWHFKSLVTNANLSSDGVYI